MSRNLRIFVAGASGTLGFPLVRALVAEGHHVVALTRSPEKQQTLRAAGAVPVIADALDARALDEAVRSARPTHVIHQLTALPKDGPRRASHVEPTNRLRIDGTRHLLAAATAAGAHRFIAGSFAPLSAAGPDAPRVFADAIAAVHSMESQVLEASRTGAIEGVVLRYGMFYGSDVAMTRQMIAMVRRRLVPVVRGDNSLLPCIHLDDAIRATVASLEFGAPGGAYDIVDDRPVSMSEIVRTIASSIGAPAPLAVPAWVPRILSPYLAAMTALRLELSNADARRALRWQPRFPTWREGLAQTLSHAA